MFETTNWLPWSVYLGYCFDTSYCHASGDGTTTVVVQSHALDNRSRSEHKSPTHTASRLALLCLSVAPNTTHTDRVPGRYPRCTTKTPGLVWYDSHFQQRRIFFMIVFCVPNLSDFVIARCYPSSSCFVSTPAAADTGAAVHERHVCYT